MSYILDTTVLIDWAGGHHGVEGVVERVFRETDLVYTCDVITCEALSGGTDEERALIRRILRTLEYLALDPEGADHAGELRQMSGRTSATTLGDALIAALAWRLGAAVVTRNAADFSPYGIEVLTYGGPTPS